MKFNAPVATFMLVVLAAACCATSVATSHCEDDAACSTPKTLSATMLRIMELKRLDSQAEAIREKDRLASQQQRLQSPTSSDGTQRVAAGPAACVSGSAGEYPCSNVNLVGQLNAADLGLASGDFNDLWGWSDEATGREFAIIGHRTGVAFAELDGDVISPRGVLPTATSNSDWRDIKVLDHYALIVSEASAHGMQIFDLHHLVDTPSDSSTVWSSSARYTEVGSAHNVVVNDDTAFAYIVGSNTCSGGLHVVDMSDPLSPTYVGCFDEDGYVHDAECVVYTGPDSDYTGAEVCFCFNEDTLTIVDVTDKASMSLISKSSYPGASYTHQGWLTDDQTYLLVDDEYDEASSVVSKTSTIVMDVSNLDSPSYVGAHAGTTSAVDHNQYVLGTHTFQANYRAGLRILRMDDISTASFTEVGYFDVYPASNSNNYNGAWSSYPYLPSGNVLVSSIERGLFIVRPAGEAVPVLTSAPTTLVLEGTYGGYVISSLLNVEPST